MQRTSSRVQKKNKSTREVVWKSPEKKSREEKGRSEKLTILPERRSAAAGRMVLRIAPFFLWKE